MKIQSSMKLQTMTKICFSIVIFSIITRAKGFGFFSEEKCPEVDDSPYKDDSIHHFEVSRSKRSLDETKRTKRGTSYHPLMRVLSPDRDYDWQNLISQITKPASTEFKQSSTNATEKKIYRMIPLSMQLVKKLGVKILSNRRLCFGGRPIQGVFLPRNRLMQIELAKRFLVWFSPCVEFVNNKYKVNEFCMEQREYDFLKMYLQSVGYQHPSWKHQKDSHRFYRPT